MCSENCTTHTKPWRVTLTHTAHAVHSNIEREWSGLFLCRIFSEIWGKWLEWKSSIFTLSCPLFLKARRWNLQLHLQAPVMERCSKRASLWTLATTFAPSLWCIKVWQSVQAMLHLKVELNDREEAEISQSETEKRSFWRFRSAASAAGESHQSLIHVQSTLTLTVG